MTDGYEPRFDLDREYGEEGEATVRRVLGLSEDQLEVKRKRRLDWGFYVEVAQRPNGAGEYKSSGINITEAEYWAYLMAETGIVVLIPTERLKRVARSAKECEETDGDNPTKGRLVWADDLLGEPPEVDW